MRPRFDGRLVRAMSKRTAWWVLAVCLVVLVGGMAFAVVMNQREARDMAAHGTRADAVITRKYTYKERVRKTDQTHYCLELEYRADGRSAAASACDKGVDQIFERVKEGDSIRIMYRLNGDVMLEDWATGKLTSF